MQVMSDYELVLKCIQEDKEAFSEIVSRYKKLVFNVVYNYTKDPEEANDISQEVFIRIYKSLDSYNPQFKFSTWSAKIAANLCLDKLRKKKRDFIPLEEIEAVSRENDTPEANYLRKEWRSNIRSAIEGLPDKYKTPIILYHSKGMSYNEMALTMNKPLSIVKNRLYRARLILRERLEGAAV